MITGGVQFVYDPDESDEGTSYVYQYDVRRVVEKVAQQELAEQFCRRVFVDFVHGEIGEYGGKDSVVYQRERQNAW